MKTIIILGASGQVGTELCVTLSVMPDVRVIGVCRTKLSAALLERCGIECRIGSMSGGDGGKLLEGADAIFDLALPRGTSSEVRRAGAALIERSVSLSPPTSSYIYASSIMALGVKEGHDTFRHRLISRTSYGVNKRIFERAAFAAGKKHRRKVFVFRLGDVHGAMQNVSRYVRSVAGPEKTLVPPGPSNSIFVYSIAEALVGVAEGRETPGLYMLTSHPQWSWKDLHSYFAATRGESPEIIETSPRVPSMLGRVKSATASRLLRHRELLTGYVLARSSSMEGSAKAQHLVRRAKLDIQQADLRISQPYGKMNRGDAPGTRPKSLTDSRVTMQPVMEKVKKILRNLTSD